MASRTEFAHIVFYEEMADKERDLTQGTILAVRVGTHHECNGIPMVEAIALQTDGTYAVQEISIDYMYDYCSRVPQYYAQMTDGKLWKALKQRGETMIRVHFPNLIEG